MAIAFLSAQRSKDPSSQVRGYRGNKQIRNCTISYCSYIVFDTGWTKAGLMVMGISLVFFS